MATSPALKFWVDEENFFEKIVVISEDTLFVANPNNKSIPDMIKKLENGESPAKIFKSDIDIIHTNQITNISIDESKEYMNIKYINNTSPKPNNRNITFKSKEDRNEAFEKLKKQLPSFNATTIHMSRLRASIPPIVVSLIIAVITWLLHKAAVGIQGEKTDIVKGRYRVIKQFLYWILDTLGPTGIQITGGIIIFIVLCTIIPMIKTPPIITTLTPSKI